MRRRAHTVRPPVPGIRCGGRGSGAGTPASPGALPVLLATVLLLAGCGSGGGSVDRLGGRPVSPSAGAAAPSPSDAAPASVPDDGREGAVAQQVLARYTGWWEAQAAAYADSSQPGLGLGLFATGQALSFSLANLHRLQEAGMVMRGHPRNDARVTALDLGARAQTAAIEDCLDVSGWHQADARTQQPRDPAQRLTRYIVTATARNTVTGWLITELKPRTERTC